MKNQLNLFWLLFFVSVFVISCKKKEPDTLSIFARSGTNFGPIQLYINSNTEGTINSWEYLNQTPECGSSDVEIITFEEAGTYSFKAVAQDGSEWSRTVTISEDNKCQLIELSANNRSKVPPPPSMKGDVVFWESLSTGCSVTTNVTINGVTKQISTFSSTIPSCGSSGNASFNLDAGTYNYSASCSGATLSGTVTVTANQCTPVQLNWTSPPTGNGQVVFWESLSTGCSVTTDVSINGTLRQITTFSNSTPSCGSTGNATFTLPPGTYSYSANCSGTTKTGTVTVIANQCTPVQLNWSGGGGGNTSGYNCVSGNCIYVSSNAQYSTLSACQSNCSQPSTSSITFVNNAFTPINITFGGITKIAPVGGSAVFTGSPGSTQSGSANTSGKTTSGTQVGELLNWNLNYQYPSSGTSTINLNVSSSYFFLRLRNDGSKPLVNLYVNYGLQSQTNDNVSIPNDNVQYSIGYYRAWSNSNVRASLEGTNTVVSWYQGQHFNLPFTNNQVANLFNNALLEIESSDK